MRGKKYKAREDEEDLESSCAVSGVSVGDEEGVPVSPVPDDDMLSSSRSPRERIQYSQSSQRSALKELYKQFDEMKAELHKTLVGEDDEYEDEVGVPFSPEHDGDMSSSTRNPRERIRYLQYCQKSALKELYKQFDDMKAELDETKQEKMQLAERNHRVQERFKRAKEGEESRKKDLEESQNKL
ncbi:uncharacterized protein LOC131075055 [Cryptomeria japonica]|uniref:uncharacterized protein LOC131075055 n=1 Tax=Cryptomeria japonica TaxID=3369 RepID=UPI0027DA281B|nr:uncharacterized protein LOC131075055 [Cryptomeria japonica]XP_057867830.2 uncharacterized protein LOC131075055 [Cryptomeria japonica]